MHDKVSVSHSSLLDYEGRVVHDKPTDHHESQVKVGLKQEFRADEDVYQGDEQKQGEEGHEGATQVEPFAVLREDSAQREAGEDDASRKEGGRDDARIDQENHVQKRSH